MTVLRVITYVSATLASWVVIAAAVAVLLLGSSIAHAFNGGGSSNFTTPDAPTPTATGCPFGPGQCGG